MFSLPLEFYGLDILYFELIFNIKRVLHIIKLNQITYVKSRVVELPQKKISSISTSLE